MTKATDRAHLEHALKYKNDTAYRDGFIAGLNAQLYNDPDKCGIIWIDRKVCAPGVFEEITEFVRMKLQRTTP